MRRIKCRIIGLREYMYPKMQSQFEFRVINKSPFTKHIFQDFKKITTFKWGISNI